MRSTRKALVWSLVATVAAVLPGSLAGAAEEIQIEGSTTVGPIADAFAEAFMKAHPDVSMTVKKTGSGDGAAALIDGRCGIATMSRFMKDAEFAKAVGKGVMPVAHTVAMDGVCVIVHPSNPVKGLTAEQIAKIYKGQITNWKDVGGQDLPIVAIGRDSSSGTFETFEGLVMKKAKVAGSVETVGSNPQAKGRVQTTKGAVAYVGLGFVDRAVKALTVNGIAASAKTVRNGTYPVARPLFMFTNGYPKLGSSIYQFVTFHLSEEGQEIIEAKGFVPVTDY